MKLILFSDLQHPNQEVEEELTNLIGKSNPTMGYISSCSDPSREFYEQTKHYYEKFGASLTPYLDLEEEFDKDNLELVFQADAIHLPGGNTYRFLYWMSRYNLQEKLSEYAKSDQPIIGVSAGAIITTPNISYSQFCRDSNDVNLKDLKGLGLVDFYFVPHAIGDTVDRDLLYKSRQDNSKVVVASDSDWIVVDGPSLKVHGNPKLVIDGAVANIEQLQIEFVNQIVT